MFTLTRRNDDREGLARSRRRNRRKGRAFTLVELLVVVAILALLISILLPTLNKAKDQARAVVCLTNLRSISLAMAQYACEYNGWAHAANGNPELYGGDGKTWYGTLMDEEFLPGPESDLSYCPLTNVAPRDPIEHGRYSYGMRAASTSTGTYGTGYFKILLDMECRAGWTRSFIYPYSPGEFIMFADTIRAYPGYGLTQWYGFVDDMSGVTSEINFVDPRHSGAVNCAFGDSHAEPVRRDRLNELGIGDIFIWPEP